MEIPPSPRFRRGCLPMKSEFVNQCETPVAFIIFNRPEKTSRVFKEICKARPKQLFIIADGPRTDEERALTDAVRKVVEHIDWPCEVFRNYSDINLTCAVRPPSGVSWVFEHVDRAIFLEDDCLPQQSFFKYCTELLEYYKDDERVMHIGGNNMHQKNPYYVCPESYSFSISPDLWGWATWRRAWKHYDIELKHWPEVEKQGLLKNVFADNAVRDKWERLFRLYHAGKVNSWDGQWAFACFINRGLTIVPKRNLITNIGVDADSTHKYLPNDQGANLPSFPIETPLIHPFAILPNAVNDAYTFKHIHGVNKYLRQRVIWFFKSHFPRLYRLLRSLYHTMK